MGKKNERWCLVIAVPPRDALEDATIRTDFVHDDTVQKLNRENCHERTTHPFHDPLGDLAWSRNHAGAAGALRLAGRWRMN
jgi:hypothetical protein